MDLSRVKELTVGGRFGSYRGVCAALDEPIKGGKGKINQLSRWRLQFTWKTIGNTWEILAVHPDKDAELKGLTSIAITTALLLRTIQNEIKTGNQIIQVNDNTVEVKNKRIAESQLTRIGLGKETMLAAAGLINKDFTHRSSQLKENPLERKFFANAKKLNFVFLLTALRTLHDERVAFVERGFEVTIGGVTKPATVAQTLRILEIQSLQLDNFDCKSIWEIHTKNKDKVYYNCVSSMLSREFKITHHKELFILVTSTLLLELYYNRIIKLFTDEESLQIVNNSRSVERLQKFFKKAYNKYLLELINDGQFVDFLKPIYEKETLPTTYVDENFKLIDQFIKL